MSKYILPLILFSVLACSSSSDQSNEESNQGASTSSDSDFEGRYKLTIGGETYEFTDMSKSGSRVSFQDKGIAVLIENPEDYSKLATITILSPEMYNRTTHNYTNESGRWVEEMGKKRSDEDYDKRALRSYNFKFRRLDKMGEKEFVELDRGTVTMEYDDDNADFTLTFEGGDLPSANEESDQVNFSGKIVLKNAYLMDTRD